MCHDISIKFPEANSRLRDLVDAALRGEKVYIQKDDQSVAQLVSLHMPKKRQFGSAKGMVEMADDFDAPLNGFTDYMG